jgi:REP element-mobilizing transposase RayT
VRLKEFDYASPGAYFVTVCSLGRACLFGRTDGDSTSLSEIGQIVCDCWLEIPFHYPKTLLDTFVVMPNHLHAIIHLTAVGADHGRPLPRVIASFKAAATSRAGERLWQRSFHERVIRDEAELQALRQYIEDNPLNWSLDRENPRRPPL